ncbi:tryptophan synthase subunit alpha [Bacillus sp. DNRA2]|uniref:tryptophan synthase subunit alpha n=1 Tax=Bacillus sp. DNRA2 TaxID=2723053 RepID=UPI00145C89C6|nr:tryptophan synthase subunit alpha [Bacillus sp. DNRA2]NMD69963.1 tryptophan synthase subunit alpha [Bacillus sp. DNRA2]
MSRIRQAFMSLKEKKEKAFVPYIMAGDGGLEVLGERIVFLEKCGATAIEIGIPFSDPVADGPTIQQAGIRALERGTSLRDILNAVGQIRPKVQIPLIIMTYMNPIIALGVDEFVNLANEAGIDGCIIPDLPIEEEEIIDPLLERVDIDLIRLVTLTSSLERLTAISERGRGFLYAVTVTGITGARSGFDEKLGHFLQQVKQLSSIPVLAGFGISSPEHVKEVSQYCDGVIVGSKIVDLFAKNDHQGIETLIQSSKTVTTK